MSTSGQPKQVDPKWASQVTPELEAAVREKGAGGSITCPVLRKLAEDFGVPYKVAGAAADIVGVKVKNCDLGCF